MSCDVTPDERVDFDVTRALPLLAVVAGFKREPEHFIVDELLGFEPGGGGEHLWLRVEKRNENTEQLARRLARWANVKPMAVSYSGMKDRFALTRQWFSIQLPGAKQRDIDFAQCPANVIEHVFHSRKLKRGTHRFNRFEILLKDVQGDRAQIDARLQYIARHGVPNYFGSQRFGRNGDNIAQVLAMFGGESKPSPHLRSILLSAARAYLFNAVLSQRVADGSWLQPMPGDVCNLDGSGSVFGFCADDASIITRMSAGGVHLTGPLWGKAEADANGCATADTAALELAVAQRFPELKKGLEVAGLRLERRALRLMPRELEFQWGACDLTIGFHLTKGAFATTVLRELLPNLHED